jgi:hypothetical protein
MREGERGGRGRPRVLVNLFRVVITGINMTSPRTDRGSRGVALYLYCGPLG